jgi:hypothetical protein
MPVVDSIICQVGPDEGLIESRNSLFSTCLFGKFPGVGKRNETERNKTENFQKRNETERKKITKSRNETKRNGKPQETKRNVTILF